jgi:hypothetical protein
LPQQIEILPAFPRSVNSFLKLFWPGVNVRLLSTDSHAGMEAASGKTTNELEQHKKNVRKKWDYYQLPADVFYYGSDSGYPSGKLLL